MCRIYNTGRQPGYVRLCAHTGEKGVHVPLPEGLSGVEALRYARACGYRRDSPQPVAAGAPETIPVLGFSVPAWTNAAEIEAVTRRFDPDQVTHDAAASRVFLFRKRGWGGTAHLLERAQTFCWYAIGDRGVLEAAVAKEREQRKAPLP